MEIVKEMKVDSKEPQAQIFLEADKILRFASERKITLRLLGGVGVWFAAPSASKVGYARKYGDIDFVGYRKQAGQIEKLFADMGYNARGIFNKIQGDSRLMFFNAENGRRIDIFLDRFVMCHEFDLKDRLELSERSLTPADLLLTKLQIVEINKKDVLDIAAILVDLPVSNKHSEIDLKRIVSFTSSDWGIYKTITLNLDKINKMLPELALPGKDSLVVALRIEELMKSIKESSKTFGWKMRARVGDKVKWYVLPEAT